MLAKTAMKRVFSDSKTLQILLD